MSFAGRRSHTCQSIIRFSADRKVGADQLDLYLGSNTMKLITPLLSLITLVLPLATEPPPTLFRNAQIFDGETLIGEYDLLVEGGIIREIGRGLTPLAGAKVVDASGKTLIPGLIDAHTHSLGAALAEAPIFGVTTHLDMFTDPSIVQSHRAEKESGRRTTEADLFSAGILITAPGGHGTQFGLPIPTLSTPEAADRFIEERVDRKSTRLNSSHVAISYAVFCLKKKKKT